MKKGESRESILKEIWEMFNRHGISVIPPDEKAVMRVTIAHEKKGELPSSITFTRPSEAGILSWLPAGEWELLKQGKLPHKAAPDA